MGHMGIQMYVHTYVVVLSTYVFTTRRDKADMAACEVRWAGECLTMTCCHDPAHWIGSIRLKAVQMWYDRFCHVIFMRFGKAVDVDQRKAKSL
jgi:hypothetical protein